MAESQPEGSAATAKFPRWGDIYEVDLDPVIGSETGKHRPALIVSNDSNNEFSQTVTVLPITSQPAKKSYPFEVLVPSGAGGLTLDSRVKANQIRTVGKNQIKPHFRTPPSPQSPLAVR